MKITNVSDKRIYLSDLRISHEGQTVGNRGGDYYLQPGSHVYVPDTGDVLRSAQKGNLRKWVDLGVVELNDRATLIPSGTVVVEHDLGYMPLVLVFKEVGDTWFDVTRSFDIVHDAGFTVTTVVNATGSTLDVLVRCG